MFSKYNYYKILYLSYWEAISIMKNYYLLVIGF
jgi:hypothetical protein